jgi:hypothetical protein
MPKAKKTKTVKKRAPSIRVVHEGGNGSASTWHTLNSDGAHTVERSVAPNRPGTTRGTYVAPALKKAMAPKAKRDPLTLDEARKRVDAAVLGCVKACLAYTTGKAFDDRGATPAGDAGEAMIEAASDLLRAHAANTPIPVRLTAKGEGATLRARAVKRDAKRRGVK